MVARYIPLLALALAACGDGECVEAPCPLPIAFTLTLTSSAGGPVPDARIDITGAARGGEACGVAGTTSTCVVGGFAGTYNVTISAPGFATTTKTIVVREGVSPRAEIDGKTRCPCSGTVPERVDVVLTPSG